MSSTQPSSALPQLVACTVCRDVHHFDLLIEDMEAALGEAWGDLGFGEALAFLSQEEAAKLEFIALAIDSEDEENLALLTEIISHAKARKIGVILIAEDVSPATLHTLMRQSDGEFVPYPLPENELNDAIRRSQQKKQPVSASSKIASSFQTGNRPLDGSIFAVHGLAGGVGASLLAVNLAYELSQFMPEGAPSVCLLDFDLQFGSTSTFLDLSRRDAVYEMLSDTENLDEDVFGQAMQEFDGGVDVLTAPSDVLPLDMITPEDISRVITIARKKYLFTIIDMPTTLVHWTETVLQEAQIYFCPIELDMRCAQNALRFKRALESEELPVEKLRYVLNRAPKFTDLSGKSRAKRMAESLNISLEVQLPDGGKHATQACDHGLPLAVSTAKNPLRKEIKRLAEQIHELVGSIEQTG
jgi:pilus assembly protein CpaE